MSTPRTVIHVVDTHGGSPMVHVAKEVWLNGEPLLLAENGYEITTSADGNEPTVVTLRVMPTSVHYVHKDLAVKQVAR